MMSQKIHLRGYRDVVLRSADAIAYLEYNPGQLPAKPSGNPQEKWTRFVCLSDTHTKSFNVPNGDVLLHSGDLTNRGMVSEFEKTVEWLCALPHGVKIIIGGNHDLTLHRDWYEENFPRFHKRGKEDLDRVRYLLEGPEATQANLIYLQDAVHKFRVHEDGKEWSVYGSPWSPHFCNWAFNYNREDGEALIAKFPPTDILLTHGPPYQIFDQVHNGSSVGCESLRARLPFLKPRLHLFGHIHEAHGAYIHKWKSDAAPDQGKLPVVQNTSLASSEESDTQAQYVTQGEERYGESTVFVNAANYPSGAVAVRDGIRLSIFGGPGFQPVVVDLKE